MYPVYPRAVRGAPGAWTYGDLDADLAPALVLHTTETREWAGFSLGAFAPHYSYHAARREWRWHGADLGRRVGTMKSSLRTGTPANEKSWQLEIVAYSSFPIALEVGGFWVGNFSPGQYGDLAHFARWLADVDPRLNLDAVMAVPFGGWRAGASSRHRLSAADWLAFDGLGAHGGVTGQAHWDTGVLDLARVAAAARALSPRLEDMAIILDALQRQTPAFYEALQQQTGHPAGNAGYWGKSHNAAGERIADHPDDAEWDRALLELFTAALEAGALTPAGTHDHADTYAALHHGQTHRIT